MNSLFEPTHMQRLAAVPDVFTQAGTPQTADTAVLFKRRDNPNMLAVFFLRGGSTEVGKSRNYYWPRIQFTEHGVVESTWGYNISMCRFHPNYTGEYEIITIVDSTTFPGNDMLPDNMQIDEPLKIRPDSGEIIDLPTLFASDRMTNTNNATL